MSCKKDIMLAIGVLLFLSVVPLACEKQSSVKDNQNNTTATTPSSVDKTDKGESNRQRERLQQLEIEAADLINNEKWVAAKRLIALGINETEKSGHLLDATRGCFLLLLGNLERGRGNEIEARRHYADAMALFRVQEDTEHGLKVHLAMAALENNLGDHAAAGRQLTEASELLSALPQRSDLRADYLMRLGQLKARKMKHDEAMNAFLEASRLYSQTNKESQADALIVLAASEDATGNTKQCRRSLEKALKIYRKLKNKNGEVKALHKMATLAERDNQYRKARSLLEKVAGLYSELGKTSDKIKVTRHINALPEPQKKKK